MAAFTVTTGNPSNLPSSATNVDTLSGRTGGDTFAVNGGFLLIDEDTRYGLNANTSAVMAGITPSGGLGGSVLIDGRYIWLIAFTGGSGTVTVSQSLEDMRQKNLSTAVPYFVRIMVNKTVGTASGGSVTLRMGSQSVTTAIASLGSGWVEMVVGTGIDAWFREFNEADFAIDIEWSSSTSGYLLVDDVIFTPWTLIDGTYWMVRHNVASPVSWLVNDTLEFTDTGGAPATGKIQYWLWVAGLGCRPSTTGTPTFTEP